MNANDLEILLRCHAHDSENKKSELFLVSNGLATMDCSGDSDILSLTPRGKAFVVMLCRTPLPEEVWTDPRNGLPVPQPGAISEFV